MHNLIGGQGLGLEYRCEMPKNEKGHHEENFNPGLKIVLPLVWK